MIYSLEINAYPNKEQFFEETTYKDENNFEWKIATVSNGFFVRYFGDEYFKDSTFECELKSGKNIRIKNNGCIFFKDLDFETFYLVRDIVKNGFTDDIWETFESLFIERFEQNTEILECELIN